MKKRFTLGIFVLLVGFGFVTAGTCDDDQTIMRLYNPSNSHVSAWDVNSDSYLEEICYDEIFGSTYAGAAPHDCTGENRILSLSSSSNAHASETTDAVYAYEVCYGNLACVYDNSAGDGCSNDGRIIARMYSSSNSHVSYASDTNYPIKVCCQVAGVYWADMNMNPITEADFGDLVLLVKPGGSSGIFNIKEEDTLLDDDIRDITGVSTGGNLIGTWEIATEDLDRTPDDYDEFYFEIGADRSEHLAIDPIGNDDPMVIDITSPFCGNNYSEGDNVDIIITASDSDDEIFGEVRLDGELIGTFSNNGVTINRILDVPGNLQIIVNATNTQGERARIVSNIMILETDAGGNYVDRDYLAACIREPKSFTDIQGKFVKFDASTTRGIRVVSGAINELLPGNHPFSWFWMFMPEGRPRVFLSSTDPEAYEFTASFPTPGDNSASLRVEID
ncbi:hypothetical protein K8R30_01675 [archaeon]|nr:hypothetical protein [archaeon]